ncbi:DUF1772 domain-containing protein [Streptomyces sp. NPDC006879]|uniref:anthrone oxygenase family protein n=1 Tax=Streptomyces sp. NPDC006879 TaxID=3364767 RepID=UPI0036A78B9F
MDNTLGFALVFVSAVASGLVAGVFYAFSTGVMRALGALPPAQGIAAMQAINAAVINFWFLAAFLGAGALATASGVLALVKWGGPGTGWALAGALTQLLGSVIWTIAFHVPRNDALAALDPSDPSSAAFWRKYLRVWTVGNHLRTLAALAACAFFIASSVVSASP